MASLTTGLIENNKVSGIRPCSNFLVRFLNNDLISISIRINGYYWKDSTKKEYVIDLLTLAAGEAADKSYYAEFDAFEFQFISGSDALEVSAWGQDNIGRPTLKCNVLPIDLFPIHREGKTGESTKMAITSARNRIYLLNSGSNYISVLDGNSHTVLGDIIVGSGPFGLAVNLSTNRIYVANFSSNNVSVIDGKSNTVITSITVGSNPVGVGVDSTTNRIYVTNWGSNSVSVIDGFTHVVVATISVGASPEGVNVNPATNHIYITNHGSNNVTVIDGSTNSVKTIVELGR